MTNPLPLHFPGFSFIEVRAIDEPLPRGAELLAVVHSQTIEECTEERMPSSPDSYAPMECKVPLVVNRAFLITGYDQESSINRMDVELQSAKGALAEAEELIEKLSEAKEAWHREASRWEETAEQSAEALLREYDRVRTMNKKLARMEADLGRVREEIGSARLREILGGDDG